MIYIDIVHAFLIVALISLYTHTSAFLYRLNEIQSNKMHFGAIIESLIQFRRNKI